MSPLTPAREQPSPPSGAVFVDHSGRRRRWFTMGAVLVSTLTLAATVTLVGAVLADTPLPAGGWPSRHASPPPGGTHSDDAAPASEQAEPEPSLSRSRSRRAPTRSAPTRASGRRTTAAPSRTRAKSPSARPTSPSARPSRTSEPPDTGAAVEPESARDTTPPGETTPTQQPEPAATPSPDPSDEPSQTRNPTTPGTPS
ncbi:hypothetical protein [Nonomuraea harbinensis]|uniref:Uncharacterized protein n=1 Tax=Nonomuraea harbinensis TaxID=1286938 RepID=A0ABW1BYY4_9ACTN|nr:hypothetical protein [Nonomuraea harbinensis]